MTYCHGINLRAVCPIRDECFRHTQPTIGRDRLGAMPFDFEAHRCSEFVSNIPSEEHIRAAAYYAWLRLGRPDGQSEAIWNQARCDADEAFGRKPRD